MVNYKAIVRNFAPHNDADGEAYKRTVEQWTEVLRAADYQIRQGYSIEDVLAECEEIAEDYKLYRNLAPMLGKCRNSDMDAGTICTIAGGSADATIIAHTAERIMLVTQKSHGAEFICGSYAEVTTWADGKPNVCWTWGHYFQSLADAYEYWKEVYGECC